MDHKDFLFEPNIRICIYNIGEENLDYHKHTHISDLTYCARGELMLELPTINRAFIFYPGQLIQVPKNTVHRVLHNSKNVKQSRYILVQIGEFSIDFIPAAHTQLQHNQQIDLKNKKINCFISNKIRLKKVLSEFKTQKPSNLSDHEYRDILKALSSILGNTILENPTNYMILKQLENNYVKYQ